MCQCVELRPAAMPRGVLHAAAAPANALQETGPTLPRIRSVVENQPHRTPKAFSSATTLELRQHPARRPWVTRQQRRALQCARAGLLRYDSRASLFIVFPHMRPYALDLSSSLTAALHCSPTNHDLLPRGTHPCSVCAPPPRPYGCVLRACEP